MHPSELRNQALVAAAMAERDGFAATAEAFKLLAIACATEAKDLLGNQYQAMRPSAQTATQERARLFAVTY
jgi:hypothetical protein